MGEYHFTFTYGNGSGDYYSGRVYAQQDSKPKGGFTYHPGATWGKNDEFGYPGTYAITSLEYSEDPSLIGQVFVDGDKDGESGKSYPEYYSSFLGWGNDYLGGESGYIIVDGFHDFCFGAGNGVSGAPILEADLIGIYPFEFNYAYLAPTYFWRDDYKGVVYASQKRGTTYHIGQPISAPDENGQKGYYLIGGPRPMAYSEDPDTLGLVDGSAFGYSFWSPRISSEP